MYDNIKRGEVNTLFDDVKPTAEKKADSDGNQMNINY
jgi:hypothetical protein